MSYLYFVLISGGADLLGEIIILRRDRTVQSTMHNCTLHTRVQRFEQLGSPRPLMVGCNFYVSDTFIKKSFPVFSAVLSAFVFKVCKKC
jgi:hypothetical protein